MKEAVVYPQALDQFQRQLQLLSEVDDVPQGDLVRVGLAVMELLPEGEGD